VPWDLRATGRHCTGTGLPENTSTRRVEKALCDVPIMLRPSLHSIPHHQPFRAEVGPLAGCLGFGRIPAHDQLRL